jgi:hypothetical protein
MKNTKLLPLVVLLTLFVFGSFAQAQTNETYTRVKLSYEVDGMDVWELPAPQTETQVSEAIANFKARCATAVPAVYTKRIEALGLDLNDFEIVTTSSNAFYRGYGDSHRCRMTAQIKKRDFYSFKTTETKEYFDIKNGPTAVEQCTAFRNDLDARAEDINLFDRIIKLVWEIRAGKPVVGSCYVTYTTIIQY